ncbi:N-alpha-acetyltransferase 25, NatB auxiliary subunit-like [Saccostrea cucullata]|uniref:N-alpha-acetyltransferase 25, NatB auxiliary subunit-like n=1 Tax=Saccostrea cuccullata TaxID=36930 RepID=UPI002ED3D62D
MASGSHVDVNERRLRPIYDCLDNGNNKKAIQEAEKALKKHKYFQCAKVLKALALLRLGRHDESTVILDEIHSQHPTDEATLQAMAICYRELYRLEAIADLYENARKNCPENEDILSALFMAYVRLGDYKKQQQTAMLLHRLQPNKNPYYFWAVMSIVMQSQTSDNEKLAKGMFLPLAERMIKKYIDENKINAEAEVQLYLIILNLLGKWEEAYEVVTGPLGEKLTSETFFKEKKAAEMFSELSKWPEANAKFKFLLKENPDHWQYWKDYLSSCLKTVQSKWTPPQDAEDCETDHSIEMASAFISQTITSCSGERPLRGPYLAQLELIRMLRENKELSIEPTGSPMELLQEYFKTFGDKSCCYDDMKLFTDLITKQQQVEMIDLFTKSLDLHNTDGSIVFASDMKVMQRHLTILQLARYLGILDTKTSEEKLALSRECIQRYHHGLEFGKDLLITDIQFSDNFLLMAAYLLVEVWEETKDQHYLIEAIVQLQRGSKNCPANFQFKVLLIHLFSLLGAYGPCQQLYESLEVKHIMNDTLGYLISNHMIRLGHFAAAGANFGSMLKFFAVNHKETAEYLIAAYKYGSFNKIFEFVRFRDKLQNSLQYACAKVESMLLDLILETSSHQSAEQMVTYMEIDPSEEGAPAADFDKLCDNRDLRIMEAWEKECYNSKAASDFSFKEEKAWLRIRSLTLRIIACAVSLGQQVGSNTKNLNNGVDPEKKATNEILESLGKQLCEHVKEYEKEFSKVYNYSLQGPSPTRISKYLADGHYQVVCSMIEYILHVFKLQSEDLEHSENEKQESPSQKVPEILTGLLTKYRGTLLTEIDGKKSINAAVAENLSLLVETLSHSAILTGVCHKILKPLKTSWNKRCRKKKAETPPPLPAVFTNFTKLVASFDSCAKDMHVAMRDLDPVLLSVDLSSLSIVESEDSDFPEAGEVRKEVLKGIETSYQTSSREVCEIIHNKLQYFSSLRL